MATHNFIDWSHSFFPLKGMYYRWNFCFALLDQENTNQVSKRQICPNPGPGELSRRLSTSCASQTCIFAFSDRLFLWFNVYDRARTVFKYIELHSYIFLYVSYIHISLTI